MEETQSDSSPGQGRLKLYTGSDLLSPAHADILEETILLIANSFLKDPSTKFLFPNHSGARYVQAVTQYYRFLTMTAILSEPCVAVIQGPSSDRSSKNSTTQVQDTFSSKDVELPANSPIRAVGILVPPLGNAKMYSLGTIHRAGFWKTLYHCGLGWIWIIIREFGPEISQMQSQIWADSTQKRYHWHLPLIATHADYQGQGYGTQILKEFQRIMIESSSPDKLSPCYLEATTVESRRLYTRVGFAERGSMKGGYLEPGQDLNVAGDGKILGVRMFGMLWTPPQS